jgi:hypothetical protein
MSGASIGPDGRVVAATHVRCRRFDDELVMIDLAGGEYYALDAVGARMWELLVSGNTPAQAGLALASEYEAEHDTIVGDCVRLADELIERGLLVHRVP